MLILGADMAYSGAFARTRLLTRHALAFVRERLLSLLHAREDMTGRRICTPQGKIWMSQDCTLRPLRTAADSAISCEYWALKRERNGDV